MSDSLEAGEALELFIVGLGGLLSWLELSLISVGFLEPYCAGFVCCGGDDAELVSVYIGISEVGMCDVVGVGFARVDRLRLVQVGQYAGGCDARRCSGWRGSRVKRVGRVVRQEPRGGGRVGTFMASRSIAVRCAAAGG